jgi:molybdenum cofactor cytidylyltransferase
MNRVTAIILAAGESKRMGQPKMLLPFRGTSVVRYIAGEAVRSVAEETIVVTGCYHNEVVKDLAETGVRIARNTDYEKGMLSSVRCGLGMISNDSGAAVIIPGDNIALTAEIIDYVVEGWIMSGKCIAVPVFNGKRGHPLLIARKLFGDVMTMPDGDGLRRIFQIHPEDVVELVSENDSILRDIDTYEDYLKEINQI